MAGSKVPSDPNMSAEVRRFLDDRARKENALEERIAELESAVLDFADTAEAEAGTSETLFMNPARTKESVFAFSPFLKSIHVQDQRASGVDGGDFNSGSWVTRTLQTVVHNHITGASLSSNEVSLPAGTYLVDAAAHAYGVSSNQSRLYNVTAASAVLYGTTEKTARGGTEIERSASWSRIRGEFTLASTSSVRIEHRCLTSTSTDGLGKASSFGNVEIYADLVITKLD